MALDPTLDSKAKNFDDIEKSRSKIEQILAIESFGSTLLFFILYAVAVAIQNNNVFLLAILYSMIAVTIIGIFLFIILRLKLRKIAPLTTREFCVVYSYRTFMHLSNYLSGQQLELDRSKKQLSKLIAELDIKALSRKKPEEMDYLLQPSLRIVEMLRKVIKPAMQEKLDAQLNDAKDYLHDLTKFFIQPNNETLSTVLERKYTLPKPQEDEKKDNRPIFSSRPLLKHGVILCAILIVATSMAYFLTFSVTQDSFKSIQIVMAANALAASCYFGLLKLRSTKE